MSFEKLLAEIETAQTESDDFAKSLTTAGAGAAGGSAAGAAADGGEGEEGAGAAAGGEGGEGQPLVKSFKVKTIDGEEVDAIDGTEMLKALESRVASGEEQMTKSMSALIGLVKGQNEMIKSLSEKVNALGGQGRGRKTILSITEKTPLAKGGDAAHGGGSGGAAEGPTVDEFLAKSEAAWKSGSLTGKEFSTIDVACRMGTEIEPGLIKKVMGAGK